MASTVQSSANAVQAREPQKERQKRPSPPPGKGFRIRNPSEWESPPKKPVDKEEEERRNRMWDKALKDMRQHMKEEIKKEKKERRAKLFQEVVINRLERKRK